MFKIMLSRIRYLTNWLEEHGYHWADVDRDERGQFVLVEDEGNYRKLHLKTILTFAGYKTKK